MEMSNDKKCILSMKQSDLEADPTVSYQLSTVNQYQRGQLITAFVKTVCKVIYV